MNSRFKFRAWDKGLKRMVLPHGGDFIRWHAPSNWSDCYEVMQFTGLFDKNGVPIFEGDIVRTWREKYKDKHPGMLYLNGVPDREVRWITSQHHNGWNIYSGDVSFYEVVGNIHANPELLAEEKEK